MAIHAAPAYQTPSTKGYAAISEDVPPQIYEVKFWRDNIERKDLRIIPVTIVPDVRKPKPRKR